MKRVAAALPAFAAGGSAARIFFARLKLVSIVKGKHIARASAIERLMQVRDYLTRVVFAWRTRAYGLMIARLYRTAGAPGRKVPLGERVEPCEPLAGWRGARCWRRSNLWQMRRSAAVLAFVLMVVPPSSLAPRATHRGFGQRSSVAQVFLRPDRKKAGANSSSWFTVCAVACAAPLPMALVPGHPIHRRTCCCSRRSLPRTLTASRRWQRNSSHPSAPS